MDSGGITQEDFHYAKLIISFFGEPNKNYILAYRGDAILGRLKNLENAREFANKWLDKNKDYQDFTIQSLDRWFENMESLIKWDTV